MTILPQPSKRPEEYPFESLAECIYFDNAATTPVREEVKDAIKSHLDVFGNPSSKHPKGLFARQLVERVRQDFKEYVGAKAKDKLIFTGCGSESNNLAVQGFLSNHRPGNTHIITSTIEHPSVANVFKHLESVGYDVSYIPVDVDGIIKVDELKRSVKRNTKLISIMFANNETGSIQPIAEIGRIARENNIVFHTDAVQAFGKIPVDIYELEIDMLSFSGHKIYAPKGIGGLICREGIELVPIIHGGGQEYGMRGGTENTLGIIAVGRALELVKENNAREAERLGKMKQSLIERLGETIPDITINGDPSKTMAHILNVSFKGIEAETILIGLNTEGICVSKGSACSSDKIIPSHVLTAMGVSARDALGSIRFSFGAYNEMSELDRLMSKLPGIVERAREMSPVYS